MSDKISDDSNFEQWKHPDAAGVPPSNLKLILLGALRYTGRAWTYDDIAEANGISMDTNREFMNHFLDFGSRVLYQKWVLEPNWTRKVSDQEKMFAMAGFNGCIGSSDATHIPMLKCPNWAQISHKGFKLNFPARTYNVTCDHSRRIIGTTMGHPATWNDKTLILFDEMISKVNSGNIPEDYEFDLFEKIEDDNVVEVRYKGVWFMVDNGYLSWSCTVPPDNKGLSYKAIRFSEWLESMRKDVECLFGIMKGRFTILRYGLRFRSIERCDKMWLTCCALHNKLLLIDGLDKNWETGVSSFWEKQNEKKEISNPLTPFAIQRLTRSEKKMNCYHDIDNHDANYLSRSCKKYTVNGKRIVSKMPLALFRKCLIEHFDIRFKMNDIVWPQHINKPNV